MLWIDQKNIGKYKKYIYIFERLLKNKIFIYLFIGIESQIIVNKIKIKIK